LKINNLQEILKELNFTQYESQALITLIRHNLLDAKGIYKNSGVPQPKIYETMVKLQDRELVDIVSKGRKKIYKVKPKEVLQEYILKRVRKIQTGVDIIDQIYNSEESEEIPFIGFAELKNIQDYFFSMIDTAKKSVISFLPPIHYDEKIVSVLHQRKSRIEIKLIFYEEEQISEVKEDLSDFDLYKIKVPSFTIINEMMSTLANSFLKEYKDSFPVQVISNIVQDLKNLFGLAVIDGNKSLFRIPIPVDVPIAILSSLSSLVEFHVKGIEQILAASEKVN